MVSLQLIEATRWLTLAVRLPVPTDNPSFVLTRISLAAVHCMRGRIDLARPHIEDVLDRVGSVADEHRFEVAEQLAVLTSAVWATEDTELLGRLCDILGGLAERLDDPDISVLAEAVALMPVARRMAPDRLVVKAELAYDHAADVGNVMAGWITAGLRSVLALLAGDARAGMIWNTRTLAMHARLGGRQGRRVPGDPRRFRRHGRRARACRRPVRRVQHAIPAGRRALAPPSAVGYLSRGLPARATAGVFDGAWCRGEQLTLADVLAGSAAG